MRKVCLITIVSLTLLNLCANAAMDITWPPESTTPVAMNILRYTMSTPAANQTYGSACALSENFAVIGIPGQGANDGGFVRYRKTPDMQWVVDKELLVPGRSAWFGFSVAIDEKTMLVGGPYYNATGIPTDAGRVIVEEKDANGVWQSAGALDAASPEAYALFGSAVALDGTVAAVGAPGMESSKGCVYLFTNNGSAWIQTDIIYAPSGVAGDYFGTSVALQGDTLVVGAPRVDFTPINNAGAAYIFKRSNGTWDFAKKLSGEREAYSKFGNALALDNNVLMVSAPLKKRGSFASAGSVYVYDAGDSAYPLVQTVTSADIEANAFFGWSIGLDGNLLAIGAPGKGGTSVGETEIYQFNGVQWKQRRVVPYYQLEADSSFGQAVAVKRNHILCAAPHSTEKGQTRAGCFFIADLMQTWTLDGASGGDRLGSSVGVNQTRMIAGAPNENANAMVNSGAAHIYRRHGRNWEHEQTLTESASNRGTGHLFGSGVGIGQNAVIVSAPGGGTAVGAGRIGIYERSGTIWSEVFSKTGLAFAEMGTTVALNEPHAAASYISGAGSKRSIATMYRNAAGTWENSTDLTAPSPYISYINFGCDMAFYGDYLVVGADEADSNDGVAFVFKRGASEWEFFHTIKPPSSGTKGHFGCSVAIYGTSIAVGSEDYGTERGIAVLYDIRNGSVEYEVVLTAADAETGAQFGQAVAFAERGRALIVTAHTKTVEGKAYVGAAYLFRRDEKDTWVRDGTIYPAYEGIPDGYDFFGNDIAAAGTTVAVGMYRTDSPSGGTDQGRAVVLQTTPRIAPADFDGDGITDIGCYYAPGGNWYVFKSGTSALWLNDFGYANTTPFVNDFDGDWKTDFGCYDSSSGTWFGYDSTDGFWTHAFGYAGTSRITGDFDGDGLADIGVFDPATASFMFMNSSTGFSQVTFGTIGGAPVTGDFDGDGLDDYGTYVAATGEWKINRSREGEWETNFGYAGTVPITGDFDGDGIVDFGCFYAPTGAWYIYKSRDGFWENNFGYEGTLPVTGDFDGDGIDDFGCLGKQLRLHRHRAHELNLNKAR